MLEPLKKTRLYEEIIDQFRELILKGELKPGDKLPPERDLALQLNVSRTAIREALRSLESMGFIESRVGGGTFIKEVTLDNVIKPFSGILSQDKKLMMELIEVRILLEGEIAKLAAQRINDEKIEMIDQSIRLMEKEILRKGIGIGGDNSFHNSLAIAAENTAMSKILSMCGDLLSGTREATLKIPGQPLKSIKDHKEIFEAVKSGDGEEAKKRMQTHLRKAFKNIEEKL
jgi:GntR family transcriptional repressor for pyruvate dehydrogenase complex